MVLDVGVGFWNGVTGKPPEVAPLFEECSGFERGLPRFGALPGIFFPPSRTPPVDASPVGTSLVRIMYRAPRLVKRGRPANAGGRNDAMRHEPCGSRCYLLVPRMLCHLVRSTPTNPSSACWLNRHTGERPRWTASAIAYAVSGIVI